MSLELLDLDAATRVHMRAELERDMESGNLYLSRYLSEAGRTRYPGLLQEALETGDDETLSVALSEQGLFLESYERRKPRGGITIARVPYTAPLTLAEGEFNRFFLRGLCLRAQAEGPANMIEIYRARPSTNPRSASEAMIGVKLPPDALLADLRNSIGVDTALKLPPGPNSGLSGRLVYG